jgi:hypothetical protein
MTALAFRAASASTFTLRTIAQALQRAAAAFFRLTGDFNRYIDAAHKVAGRDR